MNDLASPTAPQEGPSGGFTASLLLWGGTIIAAAVICGGLSLSQLQRHKDSVAVAAVRAATERFASQIAERIELYQYGLRGARGAVIAAGEDGLTRQIFHRYSITREVNGEFPGALGFGFIRRVAPDDRQAFLERAVADGWPSFTVRQLAPHEGELFVIQYVEPADRNLKAIGLDIASEANRREAAWNALRTGEVQITGPITLVQATGKPRHSFLILMPIYRTAVTPPTEGGRLATGFGWSYAPLIVDDILEGLRLDDGDGRLRLEDMGESGAERLFYDNRAGDAPPTHSRFSAIARREIYGRHWSISFDPDPAFIAALGLPPPELGGLVGAGAGGLLAALTLLGSLYGMRKRQSIAEQAWRASIVSGSLDAIIGKTTDGYITSWNAGATQIFGYSQQEAVGQHALELIVPEDLREEEERLLSATGQGQSVPHFETVRRRRDGSLVPVSIAVSPVTDHQGKVVGAATTIRDMSLTVEARERMERMNIELEAQVTQRTAELEAARRHLRTVLDAVPSLIGYWDRDLTLRVANHAYEDFFKIKTSALLGLHMSELLDAAVYEKNRPYCEAALAGKPQTFERTLPRPDGRGTVHMLAHYVPQIVEGEVQGFYAVVHDVTALAESRTHLARTLRENQTLLSTINQQYLYSVTDARGTILEVNDRFCASTGYVREELLGNDHRLLNSGIHSVDFWRDFWRTILGGQAWHGEICNKAKDGTLRWFDSVIAPLLGADGRTERFISLRTDITDRKQAEGKLHDTNLLLSNVLSAASEVSIIATDRTGTITLFNSGAEKLLGYSADEIIGRHTPLLLHSPAEVEERARQLSMELGRPVSALAALAPRPGSGAAETREWTFVRKDGSAFPVMLSISAMRTDEGRVIGHLGVAIDISRQHELWREVISGRNQLQIAAETAKLGIWIWTIADNGLEWNDRMYEIYDWPLSVREDGLALRHWEERVHPDDLPTVEDAVKAGLQPGARFPELVFRVLDRQGNVRYLQLAGHVDRADDGQAIRVIGVNQDITDQRELENTLRAAKDQADAASAAKSAFLANISHEIRTPMNAVLGMLQLIDRTPLNDNQRDYVTKARLASKSMLGILGDILDFSKIEAGKLQLEIAPFELEGLMLDLGIVLSGSQGQKDVEVLFDIAPDIHRTFVGDRLRLQQVLMNLAGNALKFTLKGQVAVRVYYPRPQDDHIRFEVEDSGIGIAQEQLEHIFSGFHQAEASTARRFGGTGLGLAISQRLVSLMGGSLNVQSTPGKGSRFWFDLPLHPEGEARLWPEIPPALAGLKVLVVDDNAIARSALQHSLAAFGWDVGLAQGGQEALALVEQARATDAPYDLILMDWRMPAMDGLVTATRLQELPSPIPPVIMLTAFGEDQLETARQLPEAPFADILRKPVTPSQLLAMIERVLGRDAGPEAAGPAPAAAPTQRLIGFRVLVVEDNELNRMIARDLLTSEGATIEIAPGGQEGVDQVLGTSPDYYDAVLMDVQMPQVDGLEATRRIRADGRYAALPIVAMTANVSNADREACRAAGMNDHVGKPISLDEIVRVLREQRSATPISRQAAGGTVGEIVEPPGPLLQRFGNNLAVYRTLLASFRPEAKRLLARIEASLAEPGMPGLADELHTLKGVAGTMGARALAAAAARYEAQAKDGAGIAIDNRNALLAELQQAFELCAARLESWVASEGTPQPPVASPPASANSIRETLEALAPMLSARNMRALHLVDTLADMPFSSGQAVRDELVAQVRKLDFATAQETLRKLLREEID